MTSLPIFIKFYQKRKASGRFGFFLFIIIIFLEFQNCFLGLESVSRIFIVLYGALVTRLSSLSTADFKPPSIWKESVLSRKIPFLPKSAATAETPQLPELRLRWHHPWDLGERGRRPWLDLAPTAVLICLGHRPTPSFAIPNSSDVSKEPLPLGVSPPLPAEPHTPEWPQHQPQITAQTSVDYWPAGKGWGGGGGGRMRRWPILPFLQEQRDKGARTEMLAAQPAALPTAASHTGFTGLPQGETRPQAINYKLVQGRQGWRHYLHIPAPTSGGNSYSGQDGPQSEHRAGSKSPAYPFVRWVTSGGSLPLWALLFPIWQPRGWIRSTLEIFLIQILTIIK